MLKLKTYLLLFIVSVFFIVNIQPTTAQDDLVAHIVVGVTGQPLIQRSYWTNVDRFEPLLLGDFVSNNDLIFIREGSGDQVSISCENSEIITVTSTSSPKCDFVPPIVILPDGEDSTRGGSRGIEGSNLAIVQPIGKILPESLLYRWLAQDGAKYYEVIVTDNTYTEVLSEPQLSVDTVELIVDTSEFAPGQYFFQVKALDADGDVIMVVTEPAEESRRFEIVGDDVRQSVNTALETRNNTLFDNDMQDYLRAIIYANNDLYNDATIAMMRALDIAIASDGSFTGSQPQLNSLTGSTTPYMLLGSWFNELGLYSLERESYERALQLAEAYNRVEEVNMAKVALARFDLCNRATMLADAEAYFVNYEVFGTVITIITELRSADAATVDCP